MSLPIWSHFILSLLIFQNLLPSVQSQITIGTPPIAIGTPPVTIGTPPIQISTPPISTSLSSILGSVFCDRCWDGTKNSPLDDPISGATVKVNCSIRNNVGAVYVAASGTTGSNGFFAISLTSAVNAAFLESLYIGGNPTNGILSGSSLVGCEIDVVSPGCPIQVFNDGNCNSAGLQGNGYTTGLSLVNPGPSSVDININSEICKAPLQKSIDCQTSSPPTPLSSTSTPPSPSTTPPPSTTPSIPGATGDPHYTGADGSHFDFSGKPNTTYCLISDSRFHINVFYGGRYDQWGENTHKALTWIRKIGVLWGGHTISFESRTGARWQYDTGFMARIEIDGQDASISHPGDETLHSGGVIKIQWLAAKVESADDFIDVYELTIADILRMRLKLRPEIALLRTEADGLVHFDFDLPVASVSDGVHGILGQTFRRDHMDRIGKQKLEFSELLNTYVVPGDNAEGFIDGTADDYRSTDLLTPDCQFNRFVSSYSNNYGASKTILIKSASAKNVLGQEALGRRMGPL